MNRITRLFIFALLSGLVLLSLLKINAQIQPTRASDSASLVLFIENKGQFAPEVRFQAQTSAGTSSASSRMW